MERERQTDRQTGTDRQRQTDRDRQRQRETEGADYRERESTKRESERFLSETYIHPRTL